MNILLKGDETGSPMGDEGEERKQDQVKLLLLYSQAERRERRTLTVLRKLAFGLRFPRSRLNFLHLDSK